MSNKKLAGIIAGCIVVAVIIVVIATLGPKPSQPATDYSTLLRYLRDSGASIGEEGEIDEEFFDIEGREVIVNESTIEVYEYANAEAMEAEASCVSPDGFGITKERGDLGVHKEVNWIALPHFYKSGRIIVMYIGNDSSIISLLENALGKQFAGM
jgi:hypothetical protein